MATIVFCLLAFLHGFSPVNSYPGGAPASACGSITPGHGGSSQTLPGGFFLYSSLIDCGGNYVANQDYTGKCI